MEVKRQHELCNGAQRAGAAARQCSCNWSTEGRSTEDRSTEGRSSSEQCSCNGCLNMLSHHMGRKSLLSVQSGWACGHVCQKGDHLDYNKAVRRFKPTMGSTILTVLEWGKCVVGELAPGLRALALSGLREPGLNCQHPHGSS